MVTIGIRLQETRTTVWTNYTGWSKKRHPCFIFCDNFCKYTPIVTIFHQL